MAKTLPFGQEAHQTPSATRPAADYDMTLLEVMEISRREADEARTKAELLDQ
jgi:hypothetical protein